MATAASASAVTVAVAAVDDDAGRARKQRLHRRVVTRRTAMKATDSRPSASAAENLSDLDSPDATAAAITMVGVSEGDVVALGVPVGTAVVVGVYVLAPVDVLVFVAVYVVVAVVVCVAVVVGVYVGRVGRRVCGCSGASQCARRCLGARWRGRGSSSGRLR